MSIWLTMPDLRATIVSLTQQRNLKLNTDLGQHFLADETVLAKILEAGAPNGTDTIVEIGPGLGILTKELALRAKRVIAIELDARWIPIAKKYAGEGATAELTFIQGNALHVALPTEPYKIIANIPYHITSPLLRHAFLESPLAPDSLTLLIQREVAEKIADPEDAGLLTIIVGLFGKASLITRVPPGCFVPPPKVDSAVLHIACYPKPLGTSEEIEKTIWLLKNGFAQKRKMLSNTIGRLEEGMEKLEKAGISPTRRPQTLSVQEWLSLARLFL
jgi:16S rRNA (adenine1518-N6/adenine1519-N6)-dimethyltransferase